MNDKSQFTEQGIWTPPNAVADPGFEFAIVDTSPSDTWTQLRAVSDPRFKFLSDCSAPLFVAGFTLRTNKRRNGREYTHALEKLLASNGSVAHAIARTKEFF